MKKQTTYPPVEITTNITANTILSPQAARDADTPDLGFHYDPLDYVVNGRTLSATLTLTNGVVLGTYGASGSYGISVNSGGTLVSIGSPTLLNRIVRYNAVQEQANTNWSSSTAGMSIRTFHSSAQVQSRFTAWSLLGNAGYHLNAYTAAALSFRDCQFGGGNFYAYYDSGGGLTNCLWERVTSEAGGDNAPFSMYNNLVRGGRWTWTVYSDGWIVRDNAFDSCVLNEQEYPVINDHNAYIGLSPLGSSGGSDKTLTNADYQVGPLGRYYYPTNGGLLSQLINAGSRDALSAGLYQYMATTNEAPEMSSTVDIGFHYGYPIDVSEDLLLIYNTNSADSSNVWYYYMVNRPLVGNANVLGIGCPGTETIYPWDLTNTIINSVSGWLTAHPTKRPQYVVLFLDIPSRVNSTSTNGYEGIGILPSVSYTLHTNFADWRPLITHLNMRDTNACMAYINKLKNLGANGQVVLSASARGYGNTNYLIDGIRHGGPSPQWEDYSLRGDSVFSATNGLLTAGTSINAILIADGLEVCIATNSSGECTDVQELAHPSSLTNVAGYICWGGHSSLQVHYPYTVGWHGNSGWWLIETMESNNGWRFIYGGLGLFLKWFDSSAFGGADHSSTPVGGISHTDEPGLDYVNDASVYFGLWARGENFAVSAWNSRRTPRFQAVGDPLVQR